MIVRLLSLCVVLLLSGCDLEAMLADPKVVQKEADAKAIGGACRHGLRSIEDCYSMNEKASKAAIFAGWKDMDQYMRDNKIEGIEPKGLKSAQTVAPSVAATGEETVVDTPASTDKKDTEPKAKDSGKRKEKAKAAEKG